MPTDKASLMEVVDRIYGSVEHPELWPMTIYAIGDFLGGPLNFWGLSTSDDRMIRALQEAGCWPTFFLSRADLKALDEYERECGELIIRFLKIVFLSILWSPNDASAREALGSIMTRRYVQAFEPSGETSVPSPVSSMRRKLIAALWEDGHAFGPDYLRSMRLLTPHLERAVRLQMRLRSADLNAERVSGAFDALTLGVILVDGTGRPFWLNKRAQEIMRFSNAVRLCSTGLAGHRQSDTQSLRDLVKGAVFAGSQSLVAISRADSRPLLIIAVPLNPRDTREACDQSACAVIFISDPDRVDEPTGHKADISVALSNVRFWG